MNAQEKKLTEEQSAFAEKHHHLVTDYLRRRRLPESEFYDVVIFRYLRTVQLYCTNPRLRKYKFAAIAYKAMDWQMKNYWRKAYAFQQQTALSLDARLAGSGLTLHEVVPAESFSVDDEACDTLTAEALLAELSESQRKVLGMRIDGYTSEEIAAHTGKSRHQVENTFSCIRNLASAVLY